MSRYAQSRIKSELLSLTRIGLSGCWYWVGAWGDHGSPLCSRVFNGRRYRDARVVLFVMAGGILGRGHRLVPVCNRDCINPAHMLIAERLSAVRAPRIARERPVRPPRRLLTKEEKVARLRLWARKHYHTKLKYDITWRLSTSLRTNIRVMLRQRAGIQRRMGSLQKILGYRWADLKRHLERQFVGGMSWKNRSQWHIDHITPLASFKFTAVTDPEFKAAWALPNLRPIWARDNREKHAKRILLL